MRPARGLGVSIHAAREGGDTSPSSRSASQSCFNPRRPRGRRRVTAEVYCIRYVFQSTPPARAATCGWPVLDAACSCFNPRRPRGRRPSASAAYPRLRSFQSTPPARAATASHGVRLPDTVFQSTPPARAATVYRISARQARLRFNPRRPRGRRPRRLDHMADLERFQSTPPARAATFIDTTTRADLMFQSTPPARAATITGGTLGTDRKSVV